MPSRLRHRNLGMAALRPEAPPAVKYDPHMAPYQPWQEGPGFIDYLYPAQPAAGAGFTRTVDGFAWERPMSVRCTLTTSAVVANRTVLLFARPLGPAGNLVGWEIPNGATQAASTTNRYQWVISNGTTNINSGGRFTAGLPDIIVPPGWQFGVSVLSEDVGDQVFDITVIVERWINRPRALRQ